MTDRVAAAVQALQEPLAVILDAARDVVQERHINAFARLYAEGALVFRFQIDVSAGSIAVFALLHDDADGAVVPLFRSGVQDEPPRV